MARYRETLLGVLLIVFVVASTVVSIMWPAPFLQPADETGSALLLSEPAAQPAPFSNLPARRDDFAVTYPALTALLALFAGLVCGAFCLRHYFPADKISRILHKTDRMHFT
ncbi:MAG: hypothetical protein Kow0031_23800 [Anaerolineae bacterium]